MIDQDLLDELDAAAKGVGRVARLDDDVSDRIASEIADRYVEHRTSVYWWEWLKIGAERCSYAQADGLHVLATMVASDVDALLVVTDDQARPWPIYAGSTEDLISVLRDCRFFEYMLVAHDLSRVIFDTHHNELIRAQVGALASGGD